VEWRVGTPAIRLARGRQNPRAFVLSIWLASPKEPGMQKEPNRYGICDNMGKMREIAMTGMKKKTRQDSEGCKNTFCKRYLIMA
jgi:hypothetical protein